MAAVYILAEKCSGIVSVFYCIIPAFCRLKPPCIPTLLLAECLDQDLQMIYRTLGDFESWGRLFGVLGKVYPSDVLRHSDAD